jgi:hypothetical protein
MSKDFTHIEVGSGNPELLLFAESFGHKIDPNLRTFVIVRSKDGEWMGYIQVMDRPATITGWKTPGLDTVKAIKYTKEAFSDIYGGWMITCCGKNSPLYDKMERLGFTNTQLELFYSIT